MNSRIHEPQTINEYGHAWTCQKEQMLTILIAPFDVRPVWNEAGEDGDPDRGLVKYHEVKEVAMLGDHVIWERDINPLNEENPWYDHKRWLNDRKDLIKKYQPAQILDWSVGDVAVTSEEYKKRLTAMRRWIARDGSRFAPPVVEEELKISHWNGARQKREIGRMTIWNTAEIFELWPLYGGGTELVFRNPLA